ncbi:hypothetical protein UFOVP100_33 [uncultured Caudovirales phage]|uniref:Uncharacterized protein n=1 Tax=uncultured Caudovirales phage TaxID=2100421 RepID=A0A6J5L589_9CAUD|nr:hypothetical protein UFOVP100_33 [uncultured Caudovirales phage]
MKSRSIGRPTKFTPEVKEKLLIAIRKGAPYELACNYARIDVSTMYNWKEKAEIDKLPDYIQFFQDLKEAEGHTALIWLDIIDKAMKEGQWTAAAWKLERRHYKHFSSHAGIIEMNEKLDKLLEKEKNENHSSEERNEERQDARQEDDGK